MNCPACGKALREMNVADVTVDVCKGGCAGIWFDNFEIRKVDEAHEAAGEKLLDLKRSKAVKVDPDQRRSCPKCRGQIMMRHFFSVKHRRPQDAGVFHENRVEVDECPACGGIWLDQGELGRIRAEYATDEERSRAAREHFRDLFGDQLAAMVAEGEEHRRRAERIASVFRFLCPSYYIPGKQSWGAF